MKLYYSPMACSLADHIALLETGIAFERERVDLKTKRTETGGSITDVGGKGYVPALVLDDGEVVTENIAVLDWIAATYPQLGLAGPMGRTRLIEALTFISTEIHRSFKPFWHASSYTDKEKAAAAVTRQLQYFADRMDGDYLLGPKASVADFYLFVMLLWAQRFGVEVPEKLQGLCMRLADRPAARAAMQYEGIL